jgi:nucleotide-binding universal stress UspA family protein
MFRKLLIANDGSGGGARALDCALELAGSLGAELHMISVEELPRFPASMDEVLEERRETGHLLRKVVEKARARAGERGVKLETHVVAGHAVPSIVEFIERGGYDLLVIGYMGHSALYNRLIGSTTDRLVELAPCKVLVVK